MKTLSKIIIATAILLIAAGCGREAVEREPVANGLFHNIPAYSWQDNEIKDLPTANSQYNIMPM